MDLLSGSPEIDKYKTQFVIKTSKLENFIKE